MLNLEEKSIYYGSDIIYTWFINSIIIVVIIVSIIDQLFVLIYLIKNIVNPPRISIFILITDDKLRWLL